MGIYTLPNVKQIASVKTPRSTGRSAPCFVTELRGGIGVGQGGWEEDARGRRYGDICICIGDSLCYKAETKTPI